MKDPAPRPSRAARRFALIACLGVVLAFVAAPPANAAFDFIRSFGPGISSSPTGVATDPDGNVYVADYNNDQIDKFTRDGALIQSFGTSGAGNGQLNGPIAVDLDASGNIHIAEDLNNRVQVLSPTGAFVRTWGTLGNANGQFNKPYGIAVASNGEVYVAERNNHRVQQFTSTGAFVRKWGRNGGDGTPGTGNGEFRFPYGISVTDGLVYVADTGNHRVQRFTRSGVFLSRWGRNGGDGTSGTLTAEFIFPMDAVVRPDGDVEVTDYGNQRVQRFTPVGVFVSTFGSSGSQDGQFTGPWSMAIDCRTNLYVSDPNTNRIQKFGETTAAPPPCTTPTGPTPSPQPPPDTQRPVLGGFRFVPRAFRVDLRRIPVPPPSASPGAPLAVAAAPRGSQIRFLLSEFAQVRVTIQRRVTRRLPGSRRLIVRYRRVGAIRVGGIRGINRVRFQGRLGRRRLAPGRYRALAQATDPARNRSLTRRATFRITLR
jgi:hypothetical protein